MRNNIFLDLTLKSLFESIVYRKKDLLRLETNIFVLIINVCSFVDSLRASYTRLLQLFSVVFFRLESWLTENEVVDCLKERER